MVYSKKNPYNQKAPSLAEIDNAMALRSWLAAIFVVPVARQVIRVLLLYKRITPNLVTLISIGFRFLGVFLFLLDLQFYYILGALSIYVAYVLDYTDGAVARLTDTSSEFGRYLDHVSDLAGDICILLALSFTQGLFFTPLCFGMMFMHIGECYISYLTGLAIANPIIKPNDKPLLLCINIYRQWWFDRNLKSFFAFADYTFLAFIICPIVGKIKLGLYVGFFFLLVTSCYTVFSSVISIHTKTNRFP